jgi:beta-fructofuranosidase
MMKKIVPIMTILFISSCGLSSGISSLDSDGLPVKGTLSGNEISLFPKSQDGFIGDPMPFFDGESINVFYLLEEHNRSAVGFHPWSLLTTSDLVTFEDVGVVIPYEKDPASPDLALGTGSVVKDSQGLYHAFYTGYNGTGNLDYFEKIQHATSTDKINWTKIPADGFYGGHNDFRDPYVLFMESEGLYWMLITARDAGSGVIKLYKSSNLVSWTYDSVFFRNDSGTYNMECPTLIKHGQYWYLTYSEQGAQRVTRYRYRSSLTEGSWIKPSIDYFDGVGTYAGRLESAWDNLYFFGWQAVKQFDYDGGDFDWGGNLVTHQLIQKTNGELYPKPTDQAIDSLNRQVFYPIRQIESSVTTIKTTTSKREFVFSGTPSYESLIFDNLEAHSMRLSFELSSSNALDQFGMTFSVKNNDNYGLTNILFNRQTQKLEFYNVGPSAFGTSLPQASVPLDITSNQNIHIDVLHQGECLTIYVNGQSCLSTRMYQKSGLPFGFFTLNSAITIKEVAFYE